MQRCVRFVLTLARMAVHRLLCRTWHSNRNTRLRHSPRSQTCGIYWQIVVAQTVPVVDSTMLFEHLREKTSKTSQSESCGGGMRRGERQAAKAAHRCQMKQAAWTIVWVVSFPYHACTIWKAVRLHRVYNCSRDGSGGRFRNPPPTDRAGGSVAVHRGKGGGGGGEVQPRVAEEGARDSRESVVSWLDCR